MTQALGPREGRVDRRLGVPSRADDDLAGRAPRCQRLTARVDHLIAAGADRTDDIGIAEPRRAGVDHQPEVGGVTVGAEQSADRFGGDAPLRPAIDVTEHADRSINDEQDAGELAVLGPNGPRRDGGEKNCREQKRQPNPATPRRPAHESSSGGRNDA